MEKRSVVTVNGRRLPPLPGRLAGLRGESAARERGTCGDDRLFRCQGPVPTEGACEIFAKMPRGRAALSLRASWELPTTLAPVKQPRRRFTPAAKALRSFGHQHGARLACSATARWSPSHVFLQVVEADVFGTAAVGVGTPPPRRAPRQGSKAGRDPECGLGACALVAGEQAGARWAEITKRGSRGKGGRGNSPEKILAE